MNKFAVIFLAGKALYKIKNKIIFKCSTKIMKILKALKKSKKQFKKRKLI